MKKIYKISVRIALLALLVFLIVFAVKRCNDISVDVTETPGMTLEEAMSGLDRAIQANDPEAILEYITCYPQLAKEHWDEINDVVNIKTNEYLALVLSGEYSPQMLSQYKCLSAFDGVADMLENCVKQQFQAFVKEELTVDKLKDIIKGIYGFDEYKNEYQLAMNQLNEAEAHSQLYRNAISYLNNAKDEEAIAELEKIGQGYYFSKAEQMIRDIKADKMRFAQLKRAVARYEMLDFEGAIANLDSFLLTHAGDEIALNLLERYRDEFEEFEKHTELYPVSKARHVFTHTLIAFPEIELNNKPNALNEGDNLTVHEFKMLLNSLYASNYVLVDYRLMYEIKYDQDGKEYMELRKNIRIPKGKIPLVLSVDAVYDTRTAGNGMVDKIVIKDGKLAGYSKLKTGEEVYSFDNEIFTVLNAFCENHPDFSFNGAKCVIATTGYFGLLGHQVQKYLDYDKKIINPSEERAKAIEEATEVVNLLKDQGYIFASHSYSHPSIDNQNGDELRLELELWRDEIGSIVGPVDFYVYPYGDVGTTENRTYLNNIIRKFGFYVFNGCGAAVYNVDGFPWDRSADVLYVDRFTLSGTTLRYYGAGKAAWVKEWDLLLTDGTTPKDIYDHDNRYVKYSK